MGLSPLRLASLQTLTSVFRAQIESNTTLSDVSIVIKSVPSFHWFCISEVPLGLRFLGTTKLLQPQHTALGKVSPPRFLQLPGTSDSYT